MNDPINAPLHYQGKVQPVEALEDWSTYWPREIAAHLSHAVPYIARVGRKDDPVVDLRKARWWIDRAIVVLEGKPTTTTHPQVSAALASLRRPELPSKPFVHHDQRNGTTLRITANSDSIEITVETTHELSLPHQLGSAGLESLQKWMGA